MDILFSHISVITMDERLTVLPDAFVGVDNGKISHLSKKPPEEKPKKIIDGTGMVLMPGLINCHTNLVQTILRTACDDRMEAETLQTVYAAMENMDQEAAEASALLGIAQCLRMGVTSVSDLGLFADSVATAAKKAKIKANVAQELTLLSPEDFDFEKNEGCKKLVALHEKWKDHAQIRAEAGLQAEYTSCEPLWRALAEYCVNNHLGLHTSISRRAWENEDCLERTGLTPVQLMDCSGLFSAKVTAAHCGCLEAGDMATLGRRKASAVLCPMTDRKQAVPVADMTALVKAGMNVALGTGSAAEAGSMDLLLQARQAALEAKSKSDDPRVLSASAALLMATVCGARAQGRANTGMVKVGFDADLIALDFTQPHLIPSHDILASVVYGATGSDVCMTMVDGEILYASGKFFTIDMNRVMNSLASHALPTVFAKKEEVHEK